MWSYLIDGLVGTKLYSLEYVTILFLEQTKPLHKLLCVPQHLLLVFLVIMFCRSFAACGFSPEIMKNLQMKKYQDPTPIQKYVIPLILQKKGWCCFSQ